MTDALSIPREISELDASWLTDALRRAGVLTSGRVTRVDATPFAEGMGLLSRLLRLVVEYDAEASPAPTSFVAKIPTSSPENYELSVGFRFYLRELDFYRHLPSEWATRIPKFFYGAAEPDGRSFVLLLEDLGRFRMGDQIRGADADEVRAVFEAAAKMHATFWGRLESTHPDWLIDGRSPFHAGLIETLYRSALPTVLTNFAEFFPPVLRDAAERLTNYVPIFWEKMEEAPTTIVHGDLRLDNVLFDGPASASALAFVDFQICSRGKAGFDIGYFLSQSVEPEVRRAFGSDLVRIYHRALEANGVVYDFESLDRDVRRAVVFCLVYPVIVCAHLDATNERTRAFGEHFLRRALSAIDDLRAYEYLDEVASVSLGATG